MRILQYVLKGDQKLLCSSFHWNMSHSWFAWPCYATWEFQTVQQSLHHSSLLHLSLYTVYRASFIWQEISMHTGVYDNKLIWICVLLESCSTAHWCPLESVTRASLLEQAILKLQKTLQLSVKWMQSETQSFTGDCEIPANRLIKAPFFAFQHIKPFLLLSKRRTALIAQCLKDSETNKPNNMPKLYINRRVAMEHRNNPSLDPSCKNAVFSQVCQNNPKQFACMCRRRPFTLLIISW